jgi:hypothetical protein
VKTLIVIAIIIAALAFVFWPMMRNRRNRY